ncbi:TLC domain-containing protein [Mycotypha africana]|uniref:TLC domain-containing protein n=1 Tax=Mycotypha africana TaxID=64632 RepID=UPI0023008231|nr:TLC domain-containing protein [Mycotypha africana]KAI8967638.1 TLC domain-containing protein [Mycotypha africana]
MTAEALSDNKTSPEKPTKYTRATIKTTAPTTTSTPIKERILKHELEITALLCSFTLLGYVSGFPIARKSVYLSYRVKHENAVMYDKGPDDLYFVGFWVVAFTFLRAFVMRFIFHPLARLFDVKSYAKRQRFAEQASMFTYYTVFWTFGMNIMYHSPHWFDSSQYWIGYPHILMSKRMKLYYLMQFAFWIQQLYTIHIEKRRKDHFAMLSHHIITLVLISSSYYTNFTRIGNAVLCCMDFADILLALAKMLKYIGFSFVCDIAFGLFALAWPITRHGLFSMIIWSTTVEPEKYLDMKWEPEKGKYFTPFTQKIYILLFILLNCLMFYWFAMIVKVIIKVLQGNNAEDSRSDDEDEEDSIHVNEQKPTVKETLRKQEKRST